MYSKATAVPSETPSSPDQPALHPAGSKRFGKKLYAIAAIVVIVVIAVALLIPQGAATIPLSVEYTVGEKMVYNMIETVTIQMANSSLPAEYSGYSPYETDINSTEIVEVVDFDGEYYTLNHTITATLGHMPVSMAFIEKVNKTGYTGYFTLGGTEQLWASNMSTDPFVTALLDKPEVKVGDSWQIPMNSGNSNVSMTGEMTITFGGIQDLTVPAGTYKVFRIDVSSNNLSMKINIPTTTNTSIQNTMKINISGQIYIEYGTCRRIESNMQMIQMTSSSQEVGASATISTSVQTTLVQHIKPVEKQPDTNP